MTEPCAFMIIIKASSTVCNVLHGWSREQKNEQPNNAPSPKNQCSCRLSGSSENRAFERCRSTVIIPFQLRRPLAQNTTELKFLLVFNTLRTLKYQLKKNHAEFYDYGDNTRTNMLAHFCLNFPTFTLIVRFKV